MPLLPQAAQRELNILNIAKDGRDMYAVRCRDAKEYRRGLALLKAQQIDHIVVDTDPKRVRQLARADFELFDMEDFYYNRVNMSGWRLVDRDSDKVKESLQVMEKFHPIGASIISGGHIKTEPALLYDAVQILCQALAITEDFHPGNVSCDKDIPWNHGKTIYDNINNIQAHGLTGPIEFKNGVRTNFHLQLMRLTGGEKGGMVVSGHWTPGEGLAITDPAAYTRDPPPNVTLTVVTVEEKPYVMVKEGWNLQGNARFEGFCIDLLARVAARAGFHYRLRLVPDNMYGARDPDTGHWNGIVRELMDRVGNALVTPPLRVSMGGADCVPSGNPSTSTHVCGHETKLLTNQFNVCNSFWFITGTFLRQGSGLNPKATSTRIVGGIWWFFTLIILSSYTANLAAFLTVERTVLPIQSAADLAAQSSIQYGTLNGGSTMSFFRDSNIDIYQKMWLHMSSASPPALVSSYEEGVRRVLAGNYAFLMESTMLDHRVQRDCNLTQIGGLLDSKGYGIATWKGSPWRDKISLAILELQEKGVIQILYDKWWKNTGDVCNRDGKDSKANPLGVQNIGGVFVTLLCGLALAIVVAILEFCWNTKKNASQGRQSLCSEMGQVTYVRVFLAIFDENRLSRLEVMGGAKNSYARRLLKQNSIKTWMFQVLASHTRASIYF
ncbi:unnamed protein product [Spodoptera exigua]|nr:unnamed protein product [Spodoptera exigua]